MTWPASGILLSTRTITNHKSPDTFNLVTKKRNGGMLLVDVPLALNDLSTRIFSCIDRLLYVGLIIIIIIIIMALYGYYVNMTVCMHMVWYVHFICRSYLFAAQ